MSMIRLSDATLKQKAAEALSFKEKVELVRLIDKLHADVIELPGIRKKKADTLFIKTICETVNHCIVSVETSPDIEEIDSVAEALKGAEKARISIAAPVSLVQMEYLYHKKAEAVLADVTKAVAHAKSLAADVEFAAIDATRSDEAFLCSVLQAAGEAGADVLTVCDSAGIFLPGEMGAFIERIKANVPALAEAALGISCSDEMALADACSIAAVFAGAKEVQVSIYPEKKASLHNVARILSKKGEEADAECSVRMVELDRLTEQAERMFTTTRSKTTPFEAGVRDETSDRFFTINDSIETIVNETRKLGYDLTEGDQVKVYEEFRKTAEKKEQVSDREIDAIVAAVALQVPLTYVIEDFIINSCNSFSASAHIRLLKKGEMLESVALGDGAVDAAFLAIEQIVGRHYELDDFQIRAVTRGREAMGETIVKLRSGGKLYSGRGLSTDIIGSSISAYINALNKIVYEEENE